MTVVVHGVPRKPRHKADSPARPLAIAFTVVMLSGVVPESLRRFRLGRLHHPDAPYTVNPRAFIERQSARF